MKNPEVAFVIIGYHPNPKILDSLLKVLAGYPVVLIDNGGVGNVLYPNVNLIHCGKNTGYAGGVNLGLEYAFSHGAVWTIVCNQDLSITSKALEKLVAGISRAPIGISGPFAGGLDPKRMTTVIPSSRVDYITGSCLAIHRDVYETIGNFYEPYFLYYEEVDYCIRAKRAGFALTLLPADGGITHEESVTLGNDSLAHQYYLSRNHLLLVQRLALGRVKCYEFMRMPFTVLEHMSRKQWGALEGIRAYFFQQFGVRGKLK